MYCKQCGKQIAEDDKFCKECGAQAQLEGVQAPVPQIDIPVTPSKKRRGKGCLITLIIAIFFIGVVSVGIVSMIGDAPEGAGASLSLAFEDMLSEQTDSTPEQIKHILDTFDACGVHDVTSVEYFAELDDGGAVYEVTNEHYPLMLAIDGNGDLLEINVKQRDTQLYADGEIDYIFVSREDRNTYQTASQLLINEALLSPSSAKYSNWNIWQQKERVYVRGEVEAVNAFNVKISHQFQFIYVNGNPISLIIDGEEYLS